MTDLYASEEETNALIQPDTRTLEQKKAAKLADKNWMNEQGAEPERTWVGLTDDDCFEALKAIDSEAKRLPLGFSMFAANIQAKLKEKNT